MCTVAVVARSGGGYIVAHNRDERRTRSRGVPPEAGLGADSALFCPRDPDGGGTWVGVNRAGLTFCMLNAPDPSPDRLPDSPVSRGTLPAGLAPAVTLTDVRRLFGSMDPARYRPFHLVTVTGGETIAILELRWNGREPVWTPREAPALFVSSSLHPISADKTRAAAWERFIAENSRPDRRALARFMENHEPEKSSLSTCMHRDDAVTVSRTVIEARGDNIVMEYTDGSPCDPGAPTSTYEVSLTDSPR